MTSSSYFQRQDQPQPRRTCAGFLYAIRRADATRATSVKPNVHLPIWTKIGFTASPKERIATLQTACPERLFYVRLIQVSHAFQIEQAIHRILRHEMARVKRPWRSEWFLLSNVEINALFSVVEEHSVWNKTMDKTPAPWMTVDLTIEQDDQCAPPRSHKQFLQET